MDLLLLLADDMTWKEWAIRLVADYSYVGVFLFLIACGLGFPCPEEVALIGGGYAVYQAGLRDPLAGNWDNVLLMCAVAMAGVLLGDTILYMLGRRAGRHPEKLPLIGRHLTRERMRRARRLFRDHGAKAVFFGRFLFGIRAVTFFVSGSLRVPLPLFLLMDGLAGLLSVPTSIIAAWYFGKHLQTALEKVGELHDLVLVLVAVLLVVVVAWVWRRSSSQKPGDEADDDELDEQRGDAEALATAQRSDAAVDPGAVED
ncbi:MAG: DedA family protein [Planctomycetota bacterium]